MPGDRLTHWLPIHFGHRSVRHSLREFSSVPCGFHWRPRVLDCPNKTRVASSYHQVLRLSLGPSSQALAGRLGPLSELLVLVNRPSPLRVRWISLRPFHNGPKEYWESDHQRLFVLLSKDWCERLLLHLDQRSQKKQQHPHLEDAGIFL